MKDAYTFDRDREGLDAGYEKHVGAYDRHLRPARAGLVQRRVRRRDDGRLRRARVHGAVRGRRERGRARARLRRQRRGRRAPSRSPSSCRRRCPRRSWSRRPGMVTVAAVAGALGVPAGALLKAYPVIVGERAQARDAARRPPRRTRSSCRTRSAPSSGPRRRRSSRSASARPATSARSASTSRSCSTAASRPAATSPAPTVPTRTCAASSRAATSRSSPSTSAPSRRATRSAATPIRIEPAIEVGNIFKLGTRFSEPLGATYLDESGQPSS